MIDDAEIRLLWQIAKADLHSDLARLIGTTMSPDGDEALVALVIGDPREGHFDVTHLARENNTWSMRFSTSADFGYGFSSLDADQGVLYLIAHAPDIATQAVIRSGSERCVVSVGLDHLVFASVWKQRFGRPLDERAAALEIEEFR